MQLEYINAKEILFSSVAANCMHFLLEYGTFWGVEKSTVGIFIALSSNDFLPVGSYAIVVRSGEGYEVNFHGLQKGGDEFILSIFCPELGSVFVSTIGLIYNNKCIYSPGSAVIRWVQFTWKGAMKGYDNESWELIPMEFSYRSQKYLFSIIFLVFVFL